jgi:hypothetical protein
MSLKSILAALALAVLPAVAEATPIYAPVPTSEYVTIDGVDWAWASPCAYTGGCSTIDMSFQSGEGWRLPTAQEVATLIFGDLAGFLAHFDGGNICASAWFDNQYSHCDFGDASQGYIWNGPSPYGYYDETFVLRDAVAAIPVPAGGLLLLSALGGIAAFGRRRKAA